MKRHLFLNKKGFALVSVFVSTLLPLYFATFASLYVLRSWRIGQNECRRSIASELQNALKSTTVLQIKSWKKTIETLPFTPVTALEGTCQLKIMQQEQTLVLKILTNNADRFF